MRFYGLLLVTLVLSACASLPSVIGPFPEESAPAPADSGILAGIEDSIARSKDSEYSAVIERLSRYLLKSFADPHFRFSSHFTLAQCSCCSQSAKSECL